MTETQIRKLESTVLSKNWKCIIYPPSCCSKLPLTFFLGTQKYIYFEELSYYSLIIFPLKWANSNCWAWIIESESWICERISSVCEPDQRFNQSFNMRIPAVLQCQYPLTANCCEYLCEYSVQRFLFTTCFCSTELCNQSQTYLFSAWTQWPIRCVSVSQNPHNTAQNGRTFVHACDSFHYNQSLKHASLDSFIDYKGSFHKSATLCTLHWNN